ncbi:MAG TPA: hypothetical protein VFR47_00775 [Anaerolineales bacterium]|nr:hypothetical protein [Anaerolineales bacterium]
MNKNRFWRLLSLLILISVSISCQIGQMEEMSPLDRQLTEYALKTNDLPNGWKYSDKDWGVEFGGSGYTVIYELEADPSIFLSNTIAIYLNEEKSEIAYQQWEDLWFKSTQPWPEATYSPRDQKDDYRFECLQFPEDPILSCRYLQRHNNIIGFVKINLDNKSLTFTELNDILGIVDERLNNVGVENKEVTPTP